MIEERCEREERRPLLCAPCFRAIRLRLQGLGFRESRILLAGATGLVSNLSGVLYTLVITPSLLLALGNGGFGLFSTITAVVGWLQISNFGIGLGLQNALIEASSTGDKDQQATLVSTAFFAVSGVLVIIGTLLCVLGPLVPWRRLFPLPSTEFAPMLVPTIIVSLVSFGLNSLFGVFSSVYSARQEMHKLNLVGVCGTIATLGCVACVLALRLSLPFVAGAVLITRPLTSISMYLVQMRSSGGLHLLPSLASFDKKVLPKILQAGSMFLLLQVCTIALFQADVFVVAHLLSIDAVAPYTVARSAFLQFSGLVGLLVAPLWPAFGAAKNEGDTIWIKRTYKRASFAVLIAYLLLLPMLCLFGPQLAKVWVGTTAAPTLSLLFAFWSYFAVRQLTDVSAVVLNGFNKLLISSGAAVVQTVITIGITVGLTKRFGLFGPPMAGLLGYVLTVGWILPFAARAEIRNLGRQNRGEVQLKALIPI